MANQRSARKWRWKKQYQARKEQYIKSCNNIDRNIKRGIRLIEIKQKWDNLGHDDWCGRASNSAVFSDGTVIVLTNNQQVAQRVANIFSVTWRPDEEYQECLCMD